MGINLTSLSILNSSNRNLEQASQKVKDATDKISSGKRVNTAKDDPAAISAATRLKSLSMASSTGVRHAQEFISVSEITLDAMQSQSDLLLNMKSIAEAATDPTLSSVDRQILSDQFFMMQEEIDRIASTTSYQDTSLLDGSFENVSVQLSHEPDDSFQVTFASSYGSAMVYDFIETELSAASQKSFLIEGSDLNNTKVVNPGDDLRQLSVRVDGVDYDIDLVESLTASSLENQLNSIKGLSDIKVNLQPNSLQKLSSSIAPGTEVMTMGLHVNSSYPTGATNYDQSEVTFNFAHPSNGNTADVIVSLNSTVHTSISAIHTELKNSFDAKVADLDALGLSASVDINTGQITLIHDSNKVAEKPTIQTEMKQVIDGNLNTSLVMLLNGNYPDNYIYYNSNLSGYQYASAAFSVWDIHNGDTLDLALDDYTAPSTGESGNLKLTFERMIPDATTSNKLDTFTVNVDVDSTTVDAVKLGDALNLALTTSVRDQLKNDFGITYVDVDLSSGDINFKTDLNQNFSPKVYLSYEKLTDATSGTNTLDIRYQGFYQEHNFEVVNSSDVDQTLISRVAPSAYIPALYEVDLSGMSIGKGVAQAEFFQSENGVNVKSDIISFESSTSVASLSLATVKLAERSVDALQSAMNQIQVSQGEVRGTQARLLSAEALNQEQEFNYDQAHDRLIRVDMTSELVRLAKNQLVQEASMLMMSQAMSMREIIYSYLVK